MNVKSLALSLVVLAGTVGSSFAGYAVIDDTTKVKDAPYKSADTIGWARRPDSSW